MINLIIPGQPTAKSRPRFSKFGAHTDEKTLNYETLVKELFIISGQEKLTGPLKVHIVAEFEIPKSTSKKNKILMEQVKIFPTKKPDIDNIIKICLDALNKLAYDDDNQVVELTMLKVYSLTPRVVINIWEIVK